MKTGLVLEGGAFRTVFSSGVWDAFLDADLPLPDYTVGVSAGIAYGVNFLSRQNRRTLQLLTTYANDHRYMGAGNFLRPGNRCYFGLKFSYDTIPNQLLPFDYDAFAAYPGQAEAVVTNLETGRAEYHAVPRRERYNRLLQATCAIPLLFPVIFLDGVPYLDGGCSDGIPWRRALSQGCDRVVVILTRERSYVRETSRTQALLERRFRAYPRFVETMARRAAAYNADREELFALERAGRVLVLAPENTAGFSRTERDVEKIRAMWQSGYGVGRRAAEEVRTFWSQETYHQTAGEGIVL